MTSNAHHRQPGSDGPTSSGLRLEGLTASVPDGEGTRVLLHRVDLTVEPGQVVVVTGPSGSGKSTLLALAGLLRRPPAGEVVVGGLLTAALSERRRSQLRGRHIGIVYQSANLLPTLTAIEQLELVGRLTGQPRRAATARATDLLAQVDLAAHAGKLPAQLSGGERQRVGIARALMANPTVLLADEPTASLDPELGREVTALLRRQTTARGLATVVVTHDDAPLAIADRHLHLARGSLVERAVVAS